MGEARRRMIANPLLAKRRDRFIYLCRKISNYSDAQIIKFAKNRKL